MNDGAENVVMPVLGSLLAPGTELRITVRQSVATEAIFVKGMKCKTRTWKNKQIKNINEFAFRKFQLNLY